MPIVFTDGFDAYRESVPGGEDIRLSLLDRWSTVGSNSITVTTGRITGDAIRMFGNFNTRFIARSITNANNDITVGVAFQAPTSIIATPTNILTLRTTDQGTLGLSLVYDDGMITVANEGVTLGRGGFTTSPDEWVYLELRASYGVNGSYEFRANGTLIDFQTDFDNTVTFVSGYTSVRLESHGFGLRWDDFYINEDDGFLDPLHIETLYPNAIGTNSDGIPSGGAVPNYTMVDETGRRDESTYVNVDNVADRDTYGYQNKTTDGDIVAVNLVTFLEDVGLGVSVVKHVNISGATTTVDTGQQVNSTSPVARSVIYETDPNTGSAWTDAAYDAAQFGYELG